MNIGNRYPKHSKTSNEIPIQSKSKYLKIFYTLFALVNPRFFTSNFQSVGEKRRRPKNQLFNNSSNILENFLHSLNSVLRPVLASLGGWVWQPSVDAKRGFAVIFHVQLSIWGKKCRRAKNLLPNTTSKIDRKTQYLNSPLLRSRSSSLELNARPTSRETASQ